MSWLRQIKTLVTIDVTLIIFVAWVAITNLLFKNIVDYKLFFLSLAAVFLMQYSYAKKNNKYLSITLSFVVSAPILWILFNGLAVLINLLMVIVCLFINLALEELPVDYDEYKSKAKQGVIILVITAIISFGLEKSIADYLYRFFLNYMIVTIILLRESRSYYYKVRTEDIDTEKTKKAGVIKNLLTNILIRYVIVIISTIMLATDWILSKSLSLFNVLNKGADSVIGNILDLVAKILGPVLVFVINILRKFLIKVNFSLGFEQLSKGLANITKNTDFENGAASAADITFLYTIIKIVVLVIIILFVKDVVEKMRFFKLKSENYTEDKEKINRNNKEQRNSKHKNKVANLFKKILRMNNTTKEKILNTYKEFEKITEKAEIYKSYMTATQLKDTTKVSIENDDYLDEMTDIYNEVKFSNYEAEDNQLDLVKKAFDNVRKQL